MESRLSASDMSSLLAERGPIHVHVGGTAIFKGKPPDFEELIEHVGKRLELIPRFRQRITGDNPVQRLIANPVWGDDPDFDLRRHVRRMALPKPGTLEQLRELVGWIMSEPLDLSRPLWQLVLIEGLDGKRFAAVSKTHHALVDGVSAIDVGAVILDPDPKGTDIPVPEGDWDPEDQRPDRLIVEALRWRATGPVRAAKRAAQNVRRPLKATSRALRAAEGFAQMGTLAPNAPKVFLNQEIGRDRRVAFASTELERIKGARTGTEATVNDIVLAICTAALRRFFEHRGEPVPDQLVALVPMSVRKPGEEKDLGNRIATLMIPLPLPETEPAERLRQISQATARIKNTEQARAASLVIEAAGFTPPTINRVLAGAMSRPLGWNLVISNVPGPPMPLYLLGRELTAIHPYVPLSPQGRSLSIGVLSYNGEVFFGLVGDRDLIADIDVLATLLEEAIDEQLATGA